MNIKITKLFLTKLVLTKVIFVFLLGLFTQSFLFQNYLFCNDVNSEINKPEILSEEDSWTYLEDELLLAPGYASALFFSVPLMSGYAGWNFVNISKLTRSHAINFFGWLLRLDKEEDIKKNSYKMKKFVVTMLRNCMYAAGCVGAYYLTKKLIKLFFHSLALKKFLKQWPVSTKYKTPESLHSFFEEEYKKFVQGGWSYLMKNTLRVVDFVEKTVSLNEEGLKIIL